SCLCPPWFDFNHSAFVVQKVLTSMRRSREEKRFKDWFDIFDVARVTRSIWDRSRDQIAALRTGERRKWLETAERELRARFCDSDEAALAIRRFAGDLPSPLTLQTRTIRTVMTRF